MAKDRPERMASDLLTHAEITASKACDRTSPRHRHMLDSFFDHLVTQAADRKPDLAIEIP